MEKETFKTAGIVADNYKIDKFKLELTQNGFPDFVVVPFRKDSSTIKVKFQPHQLNEIKKICKLVELHFKRSN